MLLNQFLTKSTQRTPTKEALICQEKRFRYEELSTKVNNFAQLLSYLDVKKTDRVMIYLDNSVESVISLFGILEIGGVFIIINPQTKPKKMEYLINDSGINVLITDRNHFENLKETVEYCTSLTTIILTDTQQDETIKIHKKEIQVISFYSTKTPNKNREQLKIIDVDLAAIIYTSGSTGFPKGVTLTHRNIVFAAESIIEYLNNTSQDIIFNVLPLSFDYGLYQLLMAFRLGGTLVLEKSFIYPHQALKKIQEEKVTGFPIVPTIANILLKLKDLKKYDLSSLRYITNTAQQLPKKTIFELLEIFPQVQLFSMYGLTECKRVSYLPPEKLHIKPESVGQAIPHTEVFIVDSHGKRITKANVEGELVVRGSHIMVGYWNKPEETAAIIKPGIYPGDRILYTGDLFKMDADGDLYFLGRKDDIIKTAGEKVSPKEIENILYDIDDVIEAAVIGIPDEILGQAIKAVVALKKESHLTEQNIIQHCSKFLEKFMVPKIVEIRLTLPKTTTGKISKKELIESA